MAWRLWVKELRPYSIGSVECVAGPNNIPDSAKQCHILVTRAPARDSTEPTTTPDSAKQCHILVPPAPARGHPHRRTKAQPNQPPASHYPTTHHHLPNELNKCLKITTGHPKRWMSDLPRHFELADEEPPCLEGLS